MNNSRKVSAVAVLAVCAVLSNALWGEAVAAPCHKTVTKKTVVRKAVAKTPCHKTPTAIKSITAPTPVINKVTVIKHANAGPSYNLHLSLSQTLAAERFRLEQNSARIGGELRLNHIVGPVNVVVGGVTSLNPQKCWLSYEDKYSVGAEVNVGAGLTPFVAYEDRFRVCKGGRTMVGVKFNLGGKL